MGGGTFAGRWEFPVSSAVSRASGILIADEEADVIVRESSNDYSVIMGSIRNYWLRHWRGELPLSKAYWVNVVGINLILRALAAIVAMWSWDMPTMLFLVLGVVGWVCVLPLVVWQGVGVIRSGVAYERRNSSSILPPMAWVGMLVMFGLTGFYAYNTGVPQVEDFVRYLRGDRQWPDPVFVVLPDGREAEFSGGIKLHAASQLDHFLTEHPAIKLLQIDTPGGRGKEGYAMASVVRRHEMSTYVGAECASAGIIVFLAGKERILRSDARVGFHSWSAPGVPRTITNEKQEELLESFGVASSFVEHAVNTEPDSVWYPTPKEILDQGLATRITDGSGFSLGSREIAKYTAARLRQELETLPAFGALAETEPERYASAVGAAIRSIDGGSDMKTSLREVSELLALAVKESYPNASDEALDAYLDLQLEILKRNMYDDPIKTLLVIYQRSLRNTVPNIPAAAEGRFTAALLRSPVSRTAFSNPVGDFAELRLLVNKVAGERNVKALFYKIPEDRIDQIAACELMSDLLTAIKALPPDRRHALIRFTSGLGVTRTSAMGVNPPKGTSKFESGPANLGPTGSLISR